MCRTCVEEGTVSQRVFRLIEAFNREFPDAGVGNGHIVLDDCNVRDSHLDYCLALELDEEVREFLELLRALPIEMRIPNEEWR